MGVGNWLSSVGLGRGTGAACTRSFRRRERSAGQRGFARSGSTAAGWEGFPSRRSSSANRRRQPRPFGLSRAGEPSGAARPGAAKGAGWRRNTGGRVRESCWYKTVTNGRQCQPPNRWAAKPWGTREVAGTKFQVDFCLVAGGTTEVGILYSAIPIHVLAMFQRIGGIRESRCCSHILPARFLPRERCT